MAVTVEWESDVQRMERCDHEGTTDTLGEVTFVEGSPSRDWNPEAL